MKKTHTEKRTTTVEILDDIICNMCGNSCASSMGNYEGLIETVVMGGYGSILGDEVEYEFSICEKCLHQIMLNFKIPCSY